MASPKLPRAIAASRAQPDRDREAVAASHNFAIAANTRRAALEASLAPKGRDTRAIAFLASVPPTASSAREAWSLPVSGSARFIADELRDDPSPSPNQDSLGSIRTDSAG